MGLDTSHNAWNGPYSSFGDFRKSIANALGFNLLSRIGFGGSIPFDHSDPITHLLDHSDCDGEIAVQHLIPLALRLEEIAPLIESPDDRASALQFAAGCRTAYSVGEPIDFH